MRCPFQGHTGLWHDQLDLVNCDVHILQHLEGDDNLMQYFLQGFE